MSNNEDVIRKLANQIWVAEGKPDGEAAEHWEQARILASKANGSDQPVLKRSIDPSEAHGSTEPFQPDQT